MERPERQVLQDAVTQAYARMLEIRKDPTLHAQLKDQQEAVKHARAELDAYDRNR